MKKKVGLAWHFRFFWLGTIGFLTVYNWESTGEQDGETMGFIRVPSHKFYMFFIIKVVIGI